MRWVTAAAILASTVLVACADGDSEGESDGRFDESSRTDDIKKDAPAADVAPEKTEAAPAAENKDGPAPTSHAPVNTCSDARAIGEINADVNTTNSTLQARGTCSEWLKLRALEADNGTVPNELKLTLMSPQEADYDLFVYLNQNEDVQECSTVVGKSEVPAARSDVVTVKWGDLGYWWSIGDDSRTVTIEIRAKDLAKCGKGNWALFVQKA